MGFFLLGRQSLQRTLAFVAAIFLILPLLALALKPFVAHAQSSGTYTFMDISNGVVEMLESDSLTDEEKDFIIEYLPDAYGQTAGIGHNCTSTQNVSVTCEAYFIPSSGSNGNITYQRMDNFFDLSNDTPNCREGIVSISGNGNPYQGNEDADCNSPDGPYDLQVSGSANGFGEIPFYNYVEGGGNFLDQLEAIAGPPPSEGPDDPTTEGDQNVTCETTGNPLTWILCPIFNGVADGADWLFNNFLVPYLVMQPIPTDANDPAFSIWSSFRVYGNIMLIIATLVIVFGQAIGGGR